MKPIQPTPDHHDDHSSPEHLEQRLRQWTPRPIDLRAAEILRAAETVTTQQVEDSQDRWTVHEVVAQGPMPWRQGWQALGLSWSCGALVGGLLVYLALNMSGEGRETADHTNRDSVRPSVEEVIVQRRHPPSEPLRSDQEHGESGDGRDRSDLASNQREVETLPGSPSDRWIAQLVGISNRLAAVTSGMSPLRAGSHFQWSTLPEEVLETPSPLISDPNGWEPAFSDQVSPVSARFRRDELLEEILGPHTVSIDSLSDSL